MNRITHYRYFTLQIYEFLAFNCLLNRKIVIKFSPLYLICKFGNSLLTFFPHDAIVRELVKFSPLYFNMQVSDLFLSRGENFFLFARDDRIIPFGHDRWFQLCLLSLFFSFLTESEPTYRRQALSSRK